MTSVLVIRHQYSVSLFKLETIFKEQGFDYRYVEGYATDLSKIDALEPDLLVVLGGSMGVYQAEMYPYLNEEIRILKERVAADRPTLGICLGSQLMAASQGKPVYKGKAGSEMGFKPLQVTAEGMKTPMKYFDAAAGDILQLHGDTFDLPDNATLLASSDLYANQAYRIGKNCFAVQFHPEFDQVGYESLLVELCGQVDVPAFREAGKKHLAVMERQTTRFMTDLFDLWGLKAYA